MKLKAVKNARYAVKVTHTKLLIIASTVIMIAGIFAVFYLSGSKKENAAVQYDQVNGYKIL